jgi:two-component system, NtrC family, sensor kinase
MRIVFFIMLAILCINKLTAQANTVQIIDLSTNSVHGIVLNKGWKFQAGDNPAYAHPDYDDSMWQPINPTLDIYDLPQMRNTPIGWLRIHLRVDSSLLNKPLAFQISQHLASEIYINGTSVIKYGIISDDPLKVEAYQPQYEPFGIQFTSQEQVVAVRFSVQHKLPYFGFVPPFNGFILRLNSVEDATAFVKYQMRFDKFNYIVAALFLLLSLIHLSFFIIYPKQKANLFFALSTFFAGIGNILYVDIKHIHDVAYITNAAVIDWILLWSLYGLFLFLAIHALFSSRKKFSFWFIVALFPLGIPLLFLSYKWGSFLGMLIPLLLGTAEAFRISLKTYRKGKRDIGIVIAGLGGYFILFSIFYLMLIGILPNPILGEIYYLIDLIYHLSAVSIPISLSIYLSLQYATTTKDLEKKLIEVHHLAEKTIAQEQEKQLILASQKETLENRVTERTSQLKQSLEELKSTQTQLIQSEKMASLGELTAGIAHEIQNPLNFVNNFSDLNKELIDELKEELTVGNIQLAEEIANDIKENEEKINHHGKRADSIVKGMLQHSRTSNGQKELTDINALADEYLRLAYHGLRAKDKSLPAGQAGFNADYKTDFNPNLPKINIIPQDIGRVLLNLINNAFYAVQVQTQHAVSLHHPSQKQLEYKPMVIVSTKNTETHVEISVKDNGPGIPAEIKDKIFQPFFTTKPTGQGTGLGLSLSYDIVKAHGGELRVETKEGDGSEFIIQLPV